MDLGKALHADTIQKGLKELNPDISFDVQVNRPSEWTSIVQFSDSRYHEALVKNRMPVMYKDTYICAMDRGIVPEIKQWSVDRDRSTMIPVSWNEADRDDVSLVFRVVYPGDPEHLELQARAMRPDSLAYQLRYDGAVVEWTPMRPAPVRGKCLKVGWRHTFWRLMMANIPGITAQTLNAKFNVDMNKYPTGPPEELAAALWEE